jgi:ATP-dependent helicase/nuclease subunit B
VHIRFLLGPAGSGKTHRCLAEIRAALRASPDGPPLIFLAPKQATFQLERQLLADDDLAGYTRLHILSFERLAYSIFDWLKKPAPRLLDEEGRLMVLRALLARRRDRLKLFRASARLTGFAQQLSLALGELQRHQLTPENLAMLASRLKESTGLALKLEDFATLLREYLDWLAAHELRDADSLLPAATEAIHGETGMSDEKSVPGNFAFPLHSLWLDGFGELSLQELDLLSAVISRCENSLLAFCLDRIPREKISWLSQWSVMRRTYEECKARMEALAGAAVAVELLPRDPQKSRFQKSPILRQLEEHWAEPGPSREREKIGHPTASVPEEPGETLRIVRCVNPEAEAVVAARAILRFVRDGGRFRKAAVIVRNLEGYYEPLQRVFKRYEIPFFLDRREEVSHHPLAELTRNALRTVAFQWTHDDWFAALKTGLAPAADEEIDFIENEALARGWKGSVWQKPIRLDDQPGLAERIEAIRHRIVPPFHKLALQIAAPQQRPSGAQLAGALRELWRALGVESRLAEWAESSVAADASGLSAVHTTVWEQMNSWLDNLELAFSGETLPLREWLPVLEAGLAGLSVGVIPPALDQVLMGAIDRSRNPDLNLVFILGLNESIFPARPEAGALLTEADREDLDRNGVPLGLSLRQQLSRERFFGYIAFTRSRSQLVLTYATQDDAGNELNPSAFLPQLQQIFPSLRIETPAGDDWRDSEHVSELIAPLLRLQAAGGTFRLPGELAGVPALADALARANYFHPGPPQEYLRPDLAARLYGPVLGTSVSRLEQFAACPFRFFVHSGLRAEERDLFELNVREKGSFQHDVLAEFHDELRKAHLEWRDLTPAEARRRIGAVARAMAITYRDGLLQADDEARFTARMLTEALQDFVEVAVGWMRGQYEFAPTAVELPFGEEGAAPAWELDLGEGRKLALRGRIDRVDLFREPDSDEAWCVVMDYKSSRKQLDGVLVEHGLQLQLLAYLNALRHWPEVRTKFGVKRLVPAGAFYVNLRGQYERGEDRDSALEDPGTARREAYRHAGRFDARVLRRLDARKDAVTGDQFNYRMTKDGVLYRGSREALAPEAFESLLETVRRNLVDMGREIYAGNVKVDPYRRNAEVACDHCGFQAVCRIDPWTHHYRLLKKSDAESEGDPTEDGK